MPWSSLWVVESHQWKMGSRRSCCSYFLVSSSDVPFSQRDHRPPRGLHSVHHTWKFRQALARDGLQHVHLLLPVPAAAGHHDHLLHQDLLWDLQTTEKRQPWVQTAPETLWISWSRWLHTVAGWFNWHRAVEDRLQLTNTQTHQLAE